MNVVDARVWRAELTIGTKEGYDGPETITPDRVIDPIRAFQRERDTWFPTVTWRDGKVVTPDYTETVFRVALESNPRFSSDTTEGEISQYAVSLARYLAERFNQILIYVAVYPIRGLIVEVEEARQEAAAGEQAQSPGP